MNEQKLEIKLSFVVGLKEIVLSEIGQHSNLRVIREENNSIYLDFIQNLDNIKNLKSVSRAYITIQNSKYNPFYISNHKSILNHLIDPIIDEDRKPFKTFKITCAGSDSQEVSDITEYIRKTYKLTEKEESDLKIQIIKIDDTWEVNAQITPRPLSFRSYKIEHMSGAMDPTIAYAINSLCQLENAKSYLNIFSGSATLLIEAGQSSPNLEQLIGFDNDKGHISLAIQNIKKAGLIEKIQIKESDIFNKPDMGKFDVITSDLPFGMVISKNTDLEKLYECFVEYSQETLSPNGILAVYTSEYKILEKIIKKSKFKIIKTLELKSVTSVNAYLLTKIFVCELKQN